MIVSAPTPPYLGGMTRSFGTAPALGEMEAMAREALAKLPPEFAQHLKDIILQIQDFAEDELLAEMGIANPFELTGVYEGLPLTERSIEHSGTMPDRIRLFRMAILLEWAERGNESLEHLVAHVLVHEVGHHFGLSDADMHALEEAVT